MIHIYKIFIFLLITSVTACVSSQSNMTAASDEDKDIGIGGTGIMANTGSGLGGTGIVGEITGFGSIFVNGIEIEYDSETPFTINGIPAAYQQLAVGDVVEVLTTNAHQHTDARVINLRHEVIGKVESVNAQTSSFIIQGQTVVLDLNKAALPEPGASVAVSGFRIDDKLIQATRITSAENNQTLLRTQTELPFNKQVDRWLVQTHIKNGQAVVRLGSAAHTLSIKENLGIRILQLQKSTSGLIKLDQVIDPVNMPRGQGIEKTLQQPDRNRIRSPMNNINSRQQMHRGVR
ncbi:MAG: hypothetical protein KAU21_04690 [Gammaproteobacteria bacterium]|nr:hypothetical protein [Gammaproteobacteria bacterium]